MKSIKWMSYPPEKQTATASGWSTASTRRPTFFFSNNLYTRLLASHLKHTQTLVLECTQIVWRDKKKNKICVPHVLYVIEDTCVCVATTIIHFNYNTE